jgi:hypothetical protein
MATKLLSDNIPQIFLKEIRTHKIRKNNQSHRSGDLELFVKKVEQGFGKSRCCLDFLKKIQLRDISSDS